MSNLGLPPQGDDTWPMSISSGVPPVVSLSMMLLGVSARFLGVQVVQSGKNLLEEVCGLVERQLAEPRDVLA